MKLLALAIVVAAVLISGSLAYYAHESNKPKRQCFAVRVPNDPNFGGTRDVIRCVRR